MKESPLFSKSYDFIRWLIPQTIEFPMRLSHDLELLNTRRYAHASRLLEELGRLLGAWLRKLHQIENTTK